MADFSVCVAESCTAGNIPSFLSQYSGVSQWFAGSICAYNIDMKEKIIKVPREITEPCDCVSADVAKLMADNVRVLFKNATLSVSTTGYVSANDVEDNPFCYIHVSSVFGSKSTKFYPLVELNGHESERETIQRRMAVAAILEVKKHYLEHKKEYEALYNRKHLRHFESVLNNFGD
jgi:PncC family amidohydrolase